MASQEELNDLKSRYMDATESLLTNLLCRHDRFIELYAEYNFHTTNYRNALVDSMQDAGSEIAEALDMEAQYCDLSCTYFPGILAEIRRRRGMG